jgi:hypothetical protein
LKPGAKLAKHGGHTSPIDQSLDLAGESIYGMRRDFPHSCDGVEAPRLVMFEVINLKAWKGEVRGADYTSRWRC